MQAVAMCVHMCERETHTQGHRETRERECREVEQGHKHGTEMQRDRVEM